jgi:hypothetical protein
MRSNLYLSGCLVALLLTASCDEGEESNEQSYTCASEKACSNPYARKCEGPDVLVCRDNGGCMEWVYIQTCSNWQTCKEGMCGGGSGLDPIVPWEDVVSQDTVTYDVVPVDVIPTDIVNEFCGPGFGECRMEWLGDGVCHDGCNCPATQFDFGDCGCQPQCWGMECGDDGCGGSCGTCPWGMKCMYGECVEDCVPNCSGKECGDDGCGGSCGLCWLETESCEWGQCVCYADCWGKECGDDGCGGNCGTCGVGTSCVQGECTTNCTPQCTGKECGDDGCGGSCGTCSSGYSCQQGICKAGCTPKCLNKDCGDDGCGGSCGNCLVGKVCNASGKCVQGGTCVGFCNGQSPGGCYCDGDCFGAGDCCADICQACPTLPGCAP